MRTAIFLLSLATVACKKEEPRPPVKADAGPPPALELPRADFGTPAATDSVVVIVTIDAARLAKQPLAGLVFDRAGAHLALPPPGEVTALAELDAKVRAVSGVSVGGGTGIVSVGDDGLIGPGAGPGPRSHGKRRSGYGVPKLVGAGRSGGVLKVLGEGAPDARSKAVDDALIKSLTNVKFVERPPILIVADRTTSLARLAEVTHAIASGLSPPCLAIAAEHAGALVALPVAGCDALVMPSSGPGREVAGSPADHLEALVAAASRAAAADDGATPVLRFAP